MSATASAVTDPPLGQQARPLYGIILKVMSVALFVLMATALKATHTIPTGQLVFFRCAFAMLPVLAYLGWRRQIGRAFATRRPMAHFLRGLAGVSSMGLGFFALTRLPLPESTAIGYATPLLLVVFSAVFLKEQVRLFRWSAVLVGMLGVLIILWPRLTLFSGGGAMSNAETIGAIAAMGGAVLSAIALLQVRQLVQTEHTEAIVTYFFISASILSLLSLPFGWVMPSFEQAILLITAGVCGGIAQLLMTSSYRHADLSVIAPFEYVSLILTIGIGYAVFADVPTGPMLMGAAIIIVSGIAVILREHYLGVDRAKSSKANTP
ncbi:MAG TPA: DMT family transporter [Devosia sp.]|nr:DMT family transporter [Devosia sp.]